MPCEGCRVQFTVFRRKRVCTDCKRFYCNTCLTAVAERHWAGDVLLCERCSIFAKRPLLRTDLLQLKPKDLIFYLQSKHISTAGCVEKDELICLVLNYAQQADSATPGSHGGRRDRRRSSSSGGANKHSRLHGDNSFLNLKQSCQNFFNNITDNLSDSFSSFEQRSTPKPRSHSSSRGSASPTSPTPDSPSHISDQPRVSTREIPRYASCQQQPPPPPPEAPPILTVRLGPPADTPTHVTASSASSQRQRSSEDTSPVLSSTSSSANPHERPTTSAASKWECECSGPEEDGDGDDDEIIATYTSGKRQVGGGVKPSPQHSDGASASREAAKMPAAGDEVSSQSSFEELGAIGGISDDSKTTTDTNSSNLDQWQILDTQRDVGAVAEELTAAEQEKATTNPETDEAPSVSGPPRPSSFRLAADRHKKITRRRSDSYLKKKRPPSDEDDSPSTSEQVLRRLAEESNRLGMTGDSSSQATAAATTTTTNSEPDEAAKTPQRNCKRCGKSKLNIRRQVEKMRRHLESSQMSEADIKRELREFLVYLERRTKSVDYSEDSETAASSAMGQHYTPDSEALAAAASIAAAFAAVVDPDGYSELDDDDEGINVYATPAGFNGNRRDSRFIQLEDYETMEELESLSVKQLKEVLMLNRVDYKGCCEKQELLERVERLWKNLKQTPAIEKLQTDELCKICMDAPIECVILECGHMATCTNCGKVLSECPICRQYIVRVVRFFRA